MNTASQTTSQERVTSNAPWLKHYPSCVPHQIDIPEIAAWRLLKRTASSHSDHTACRYLNQSLTWGELWAEAVRIAGTLQKLGVRPGDRVALLLPNTPEYISALNGIWMAGGVAVAMSPLCCPRELDDLLAATDCRIAISLDMLAPSIDRGPHRPDQILLTTIADRLPLWKRIPYAAARLRRLHFGRGDDPSQLSWLSDHLANADDQFEPVDPNSLDDPAYLLATGGTTGAPKVVTLSHRNLVGNAWQLLQWSGNRIARERILAVLPFFHSYGLTSCLMEGTALAATLILHHRFVPSQVLDLIEQYRPTSFPAVPAMLSALNDLLRKNPDRDTGSLLHVISGGAPLPEAVAEEFSEHTRSMVVEGYGLSEASPVTHTNPLDGTHRSGSIGVPLPNTEARIVDPDTGEELPIGEVGELAVRGPQVMSGYWNNPEATQNSIRDGWLLTGDLATQDADGFFRIVDRKKDLIITSGFNVYPNEVEDTLRHCPGVRDISIIGVNDEQRGQRVKALIVPQKSGQHTFHRDTFDRYCQEHLAKHKQPREVELVRELPKNFLGKVLRRKLRE